MKIKTIDDWGWWFRKEETYEVREYPFKATRGASVFAHEGKDCKECEEEFKGKTLYPVYEVVEGPHKEAIIPVICCTKNQEVK